MALTVKATINGQEYTLTYNQSTGKYEAEINAPNASSFGQPGGYYPVTVSAKDEANNITTVNDQHATLGSSLKLYVKEEIKPKVIDLAPTSGSSLKNANPTITFKAVDNKNGQTSGYSGINASKIVLTVNGNSVPVSAITKSAIEGGYSCSYTPNEALKQGDNTVTVKVTDNDGNVSDVYSTTFKIDTAPPRLEVTSPVDGLVTNNPELSVIGQTSDIYSSPVTVTITVNGVDQGAVNINSSGDFNKVITLADGANVIVIKSTDSLELSSTVTRNVTLKTNAPQIKSVNISPNPVTGGNTFVISVEVV